MPVDSRHPDYISSIPVWRRARDVVAGEDAVKRRGETYLPRLAGASDDDYVAYRDRASFFNAAARTADGYVGLIFRRPPYFTVPNPGTPSGRAANAFLANCDLVGSSCGRYARGIAAEVIAVGRAGTLVDWSDAEARPYVVSYTAEQIINWRVERINGRYVPTLVVLEEPQQRVGSDPFTTETDRQIRVLRLTAGDTKQGEPAVVYVVDVWRMADEEWRVAEQRKPLRGGKPLESIPFVFHGPRDSTPAIQKPPLTDLIAVNLEHYRLSADYHHGMHYTAFPTPWVSGITPPETPLVLGSTKAWILENPGARAGYLEFTGQGLSTFERAMDRAERSMAVLGSRMLEPSKKVGETAEAIELRQSGESSVLAAIAGSLSGSLSDVLRWALWWRSGVGVNAEEVSPGVAAVQLNADFSSKAMTPQELKALMEALQAGVISKETFDEMLRRGEIVSELVAVNASEA